MEWSCRTGLMGGLNHDKVPCTYSNEINARVLYIIVLLYYYENIKLKRLVAVIKKNKTPYLVRSTNPRKDLIAAERPGITITLPSEYILPMISLSLDIQSYL